MIIKSKKFILRPYNKNDLDSLVENLNNKNISKFMSHVPYPYAIKHGKKWIERCIQKNKKSRRRKIIFAVEIHGKIAGSIGLDPIKSHKAEIGYWLAKKYWNHGIMSEALKIVTRLGFEKLKLKRVQAHVFRENKISAIILEKNGYKKEGLLKKYFYKNNRYSDAYLYARTR